MSFIKKNLGIIFIFANIVFAIFAFSVGTTPPPSSRYKLTETEEGINKIFSQNRDPTSEERKAGMVAIGKWNSASSREKNRLADDIVLSKVLIGLTQDQIVEYMGTPDAFGALHDVGPHIRHTGYYAASGESQCDLMIKLNDDGKASEVYLDVNY